MRLTPEEVKDVTVRRLAASRADGCIIRVDGGESLNLRFARNSATSNGAVSAVELTITSQIGQRSGTATVTSLDDGTLDMAQRTSEDIARLAPADPEQMPPLGPQQYGTGTAYDAPTAGLRVVEMARGAKAAIARAVDSGVDATGYSQVESRFTAMATSAGLFAYDRYTEADFTITARRRDGSWSGWAGGSEFRFGELDVGRISGRAVAKAAYSQPPLDLDPGQYTVILEASAVGEMLQYLMWSMDARSADEGRSWLSGKEGATKLGEKLLDARVTIYSDPAEPLAPSQIFGGEGLPQERTVWIEDGVVKNLSCSRYWAEKTGRTPRSYPGGLAMVGGVTTVDEMIRNTRRGILVTRVWYTNTLDPRTLLLTGLTRDGNFLIESGRIVGPVRNFRFNESLVAMLGNIDAIGPTGRIHGGDLSGGPVAAPSLLVKSFNFTSRSRGI
jgi:predicted Zn-dependent protease